MTLPAETPPLPHACGPLVLRRLRAADLTAFQAYRSDATLGRFQGWSAQTDAEAASFLAAMQDCALVQAGAWTQIAIASAVDDSLLGDIGLHLCADGRRAEIGYTLSRPAQGRGLATQAVRAGLTLLFACTPAEQVQAVTDARNAASIRVIERVGMRFVESRESVFRDEAGVELVYAITRAAARDQDLPLQAAHARRPGSRFEDVDLSQSRFDDVNLRGAVFTNTSLAGASLRNVSLAGATIDDAQLDGLRIEGVLVTDLWAAWQRGT